MRRTRISLLLVLGMLAALLPIGATAPALADTTGDLVITGVVDGPLPGGIPKAIELYAVSDIADLSSFGLGSENGAAGGGTVEFTFPADAATAGQFIYVASEAVEFSAFFGFAPDYISSVALINGDDAVELFDGGVVIDSFGDVNQDGTGQPWEYLDGWAYRADGTGQDGSTFVLANWTFSGPNALDDELTNATATTPFPVGTYTTVSTATPLSGVGLATPDSVMAGGTSVLTVAVTPGDTPPSTGITVDVNLGPIGGDPAVPMVDDGTGGDSVAGDNIFSLTVTVPLTTADNTYALTASIEDAGSATASTDIELTVFSVIPDTDLLLSGVVDGPLSGGIPKAVEFFVINDIADLSAYGFGSANNGGGSDGEEFTFPAVSATAGDFIYVASESTGFTSFFGFAPDYTSGAASINGDDAIELFNSGVVIDVFGDINVDGNGQPWEYLDGWAYRVNETGPDGSTFVLGNWTFSGPDALDGETSNDTAATPFPIGTYYDVAPPPVELSGSGNATPSAALAGDTVLLTVDVTPANDPPSTGITVVADLSTIGGSPEQPLLDDGVGGDAAAGDNTFSYEATIDAPTAAGSYELSVKIDDVEEATASTSIALAVVEVIAIHDIQGSGPSVAVVGPVAAEAIVTSLLTDFDALDGFLLQEEESDYDSDPLTSEGIRVKCGSACPVGLAVGDRVRVIGSAEEDFEMSQIDATAGSVIIRDVGVALPSAEPLELPARDGTDEELTFEEVEGMLVEFTDKLVVSEYFELARFGQVVLTVEERPFQFTHANLPSVDGYDAFLADLATRRIVLDDDNNNQNAATSGAVDEPYFYPQPGLSTTNDFRGGDSIIGLTGGMDWAFGEWRIKPTPEEFDYTFIRDNDRTVSPDPIAGRLAVASFNVLNYFTTIDLGPNNCGPSASLDCRGANSVAELDRQRDKTVAALAAIDADVVGLIELENNASKSLSDLVGGLNTFVGADTYDFVDTGTIGTDAIKVGLIYRTAAVRAIGGFAILDSTVDPTFIDTKNRPVLIQTFEESASGARFTVAVNHLKSKGSNCNSLGDPDLGDGQANCNLTRTSAATALVNYLATDPTGSGDSDFLIIGDLNAYAMEDPISAITSAGYTNLVDSFGGPQAYSYVFDGQLGYLDHALANASLLDQAKGVTEWHINADEINLFDYNDDIQDPAEASFERESAALPIYEPNAFRSSDHDPVIVGLELTVTPMQAKEHSIRVLSALLPTGNRYNDKRITKAIESIEDSLNPAYWVDDFHLTDRGKKVFDEEKKAVKDLMRVHGSVEPEVDAVIVALVNADEELAGTAIDDAVAAGGSQRYIDKALKEMKEAQKDLNRNRPDKAIDHYKKAWEYAQKALAEAPVRFATFNASLNRRNAGDLATELSAPGSAQPATIAEIIQRSRPDVVLINEFDYDADGVAAEGFQDNYLSVPQNGASPIVYPYRYVAPSNTGVPSGFDLNNNGKFDEPDDAFGFGFFEGQYAFVVYSMHPIDSGKIRTFQNFLWKDMPGALLPEYDDGTPWFTDEELDVVRLSSKNHVDVPIRVDGDTIHFLVSHPTPPVFDGDEDRNGKRNYDEIRFWADYVNGGKTARYIYDDEGKKGGLSRGADFVIAGDQNSDPFDGDSYPGAAQLLLDHPRINDSMTPSSLGGPEQAVLQGGANIGQGGDPAFDTADFNDSPDNPGNLRADYVLPRYDMDIVASGVFWPEEADPLFPLVGTWPFPSSDHRLVWIALDLDGHGHHTYYSNHRGR